jgi:pyruvate,water dikinase
MMQLMQRLLPFRKKARYAGAAMNIFAAKYGNFKAVLECNSELLKMISDLEEMLRGHQLFGLSYVRAQSERVLSYTAKMVESYAELCGRSQAVLSEQLGSIRQAIQDELQQRKESGVSDYVLPYNRVTKEMVDWVGGKNANLGEILNHVHLPIPDGFAITTAAYDAFVEANELQPAIKTSELDPSCSDPQEITEISLKIQRRFLEAEVPEGVARAIQEAYSGTFGARSAEPDPPRIAMRSSALGEDSELSFAGQYLSVLNVSPKDIVRTYKEIVASLFSPRALSYRLQKGIPAENIAMSVACLVMVSPAAAGVMYTRHPFNILEDHVIINAVWGLGSYAVDGVVSPDSYTVSKEFPPILLASRIYRKPVQLAIHPDGQIAEEAVEQNLQSRPCLTREQAVRLAGFGIQLEKHFQRPQDIEWALDDSGRFVVLQSRPLRVGVAGSPAQAEGAAADAGIPGYDLILSGGDVACPGVGCGPAWFVRSDQDLAHFPQGAVLIARDSSPKYVMVMQKAQAIVTDSGSITGHMAALAREFMLPALLNTGTATERIQAGAEITVDAYSGRIYAGRVTELLNMQVARGALMKDSPVYHLLRKVADFIVPLNLLDPKSAAFSPQNCRTIHDIMRLIHEFVYHEMFQISELATEHGRISVKLNAQIPLDLYLIDLGGGISREAATARSIAVEQITSLPFRALLKGMLREELSSREPRPVNIGGFFSVMSRQMLSPPNVAVERFGDRSYAIISDKYLNFSSRVGYHYSILDAYCGQTATKNYINFEFKGGAADDVRRNRRTRAIGQILSKFGFFVEVKGDRVTARIHKRNAPIIEDMLDHLGRLLLFTRQMDMLMHTDESVDTMARSFLEGDYCLERQSGKDSTAES